LLVAAVLLVTVVARGAAAQGAQPTLHANGRIAFTDVTGIASMNPDGSGQWGVELQVGDSAPAWSPDGSRLAVVTRWANRYGILVMQPDGSGRQQVTADGGDIDPAWSPDGTKLAFANAGNIYTVRPDGTGRAEVTRNPANSYAWHPTWSPDGRTIAYALITYPQTEPYTTVYTRISLLDVTSGSQKLLPIPDANANDESPAWSPDGSTIAFASGRGNDSTRIYTVSPDGSNLHLITTGGGTYDALPAWSPDGTQIAFVRSYEIWVMARDGSGVHQLTTGNGITSPAWQPLAPAPGACTLWGTSANDLLVGTDNNDVICGLGGDDTIIGLGGNDTLGGNDGNDWIAGGLGHDILVGGPGDDRIDARDGGTDVTRGGAGIDTAILDGRIDDPKGIERPQVDRNLAAWRPAIADTFEPTNPPMRAFDGRADDWWNSGGTPSHWVEVDLQRPVDITRVSLVVPELPTNGNLILLGRRTTDDAYRLLRVFKGPTADLEQLDYSPKRPWRGIEYVRLVVPQPSNVYPLPWVSLRELKVYGR
jgi:dipeptidyl aminopeptidase/acylaminoacyl peptidase